MLSRVILIIDDNQNVESIYIPAYEDEIEKLKKEFPKWKDYNFVIIHKRTMKEALDYLYETGNVVDVLVVDFDFRGERTFTNGTSFVKHVREHINRHCQIVFYTMQAITGIDKSELIDLINSDVYQFVDKSSDNAIMAKTIFDAATMRNPIVESLERFMNEYQHMLSTYEYSIDGTDMSFEEMINHIRMDDDVGRSFVEKLLHKGILLSTDMG